MSSPEFLTASEVAAKLRISRMTVTRWVRDGKLPAVRLGAVLRIPTEAVDRMLADAATGGDAA